MFPLAAQDHPRLPGRDRLVPTSQKNGVVFTPGLPPLLFASMPILTGEGQGPARGTMIFAAYLTPARQEGLAQLTKLKLNFCQDGDPGMPADFTRVAPSLQKAGTITLEPVNEETISGYTRFTDPAGSKGMLVRADIPRGIHRQAKATLNYLLVSLVAVGVVATLVIAVLLEILVLRRMAMLSTRVTQITDSFDFAGRVDSEGSDELAQLGKSVNGLLAAVEQAMYASGVVEQEQEITC